MSTVSTIALLQQLRAHLLTAVTPDGHAATEILGPLATARLYLGAPPAGAAFPFAYLRWQNMRDSMGGVRLAGDVEVMLVARPRAALAELEQLADWLHGAMFGYADTASGLTMIVGTRRDTLPPMEHPADVDLVQVRLVYSLVVFPALLAQYVTP